MGQLLDITVIITGTAHGLGRAMALGLAAAGARVGAIYRPAGEAAMATVVAEAQERGVGGRLLPVGCDVSDPGQCEGAVAAIAARFGGLHALINNAARGMQGIGKNKKFFAVPVEDWRAATDTNVNGPFQMARLVAPRLVAQGWGRIVNIGTGYRTMQAAGYTPYGPTKAALEAATVAWAKDLAGTGVTVNALLPGGKSDTQMVADGEVADRRLLLQPEIMVPPLLWLLSHAADGVSGRRFIAKDWDARLPPAEAAAKAGAAAGW